MDKKYANAPSDDALNSVAGGMANPYDTPEKKQAYRDLKDRKITREQFASIMGIDPNGNPTK